MILETGFGFLLLVRVARDEAMIVGLMTILRTASIYYTASHGTVVYQEQICFPRSGIVMLRVNIWAAVGEGPGAEILAPKLHI